MAETKTLEKRPANEPERVERTRSEPVYAPDVDIMENEHHVVVVADMPGVDEKSVNITLENDVLTIEGRQEISAPDGHEQAYGEFRPGAFVRSFSLSNEVDKNKIEAAIRNGVLRVNLPKAEAARARKIAVKAG